MHLADRLFGFMADILGLTRGELAADERIDPIRYAIHAKMIRRIYAF